MPVVDTPEPDNENEDNQVIDGPAPSLDEVHNVNQHFVDNEDAENEDSEEGEEDDTSDDDGSEPDPDEGVEDEEEDVEDQIEDDQPLKPEPDTPQDPSVNVDLPDNDITKNGNGKVAIRDSEGNTLYFNNLDEIPDTFEPVSYKEMMKGVSALNRKEDADERAREDAESSAVEEQRKADAKKLTDSWDVDIKELKLEKGEEEKVFDYMESELKNGNPINSFKQAYKGMKYDEQQAAAAEKTKKLNDTKKRRAGLVQGGGGGGEDSMPVSPRGNRVLQGTPPGASLDAVHNSVLESL